MFEVISFTDVLAAVLNVLRANVKNVPVFDHYPKNQELPFIHAEIVGVEEIPSKTMKKDRFQIYIHGWADGSRSSQPIFDVADKIREAMTVPVSLPDGYDLLMQTPAGTQQILQDEDGSRHAIVGYQLTITSGFKMKI